MPAEQAIDRSDLTGLPPTPPEASLAMPVQDLSRPPPAEAMAPGGKQLAGLRVVAARIVAFGGALLATVIACREMLVAFGDQRTVWQLALLVLFSITFAWIAFSFFGMLSTFFGRRPAAAEPDPDTRLVIVMPIYHEDAAVSFGALSAIAAEIGNSPLAARTEIFVLSDSRKPEAVLAENLAAAAAREISPIPIWYRRREDNSAHKSGNLAEFLRRWGGRYDQMVVLDADSVMSGETIATLSARLSADPRLALIQTIPMLSGGETILARVQQFGSRIYGPVIAGGVAAWSGDNGNYWGHNAIIRVKAFAACCGLPVLPGKPPFGGTIMSHDFVEAALLSRAGWKVRLDSDLRGSYEGGPPTLMDIAKRERRWAQGNLQHMRIIGARGLTLISRFHFLIGVLAFLMSPLWLLMILVGLVLSAQVLLSTPEYFPTTYQLFPNWPVFDSRRMLWLFIASMTLLFAPKLVAVLRSWYRPLARQAGGRRRILASALFETLLSALIAPVQMLIQTRQIGEILSGRDAGWEAQHRSGHMPGWGAVWRRHFWHVVLGIITLIVLADFSPAQLIWLSPILAGLILSPFVSRYSASRALGRLARMRHLLTTPEEHTPTPVLNEAAVHARAIRQKIGPVQDIEAAIAKDPARLQLYKRMTTLQQPCSTNERLARIGAAAKLAHAGSRSEALEFLGQEETIALLTQRDLLESWMLLPE